MEKDKKTNNEKKEKKVLKEDETFNEKKIKSEQDDKETLSNNNVKEINNEEKIKEFEEKITKLNETIFSLNSKIFSLEIENQKNISDFQAKAKTFQDKAQEELDKHKAFIFQKYEEEKKQIEKYGSQKLLETIIEPILNIELAIKTGLNQDGLVSNYVKGFEMLINQLNIDLEFFGIKKIEPKIGDLFDPILHYAISNKEGENKNKIVEVKKHGYKLYDRVIKPATVVIEN